MTICLVWLRAFNAPASGLAGPGFAGLSRADLGRGRLGRGCLGGNTVGDTAPRQRLFKDVLLPDQVRRLIVFETMQLLGHMIIELVKREIDALLAVLSQHLRHTKCVCAV